VCRLVSFRSPVSVCLSVCVCNPVAGMSCFALRCFLYFLWVWLITTGSSELRASSLARSSANLSLRYFTVCVLYLKHWMRNRLIDWLIDWQVVTGDCVVACQCYGHTDECRYNDEVAKNQSSVDIHGQMSGGGVCLNCQHNTAGVNCEMCRDGFYRPFGVELDSLHVCRRTYHYHVTSLLSVYLIPPRYIRPFVSLDKLRHDSILMTLKWPPRLSANHSRLADFMFRTDRNCWSCIIVLWRH